MTGFGEGHVANAGRKVRLHRGIRCDVPQELLPADAIGGGVGGQRRGFAPAAAIIGGEIFITLKWAMAGVCAD